MNPRSFSDEGVVLVRRNYSEADRILSVYSKGHGRVTLLAKGVRKPASRKRGHIEVFARIRFQASYGRGFDLITEAEIIDNFTEIRKNLKRVALAYYFTEVVGRVTHEGEANNELYFEILDSLERLKKEKKLKSLRKDFIITLLTRLGFWPRGKALSDPDGKLEEIIERKISAVRVGKRLLEV